MRFSNYIAVVLGICACTAADALAFIGSSRPEPGTFAEAEEVDGIRMSLLGTGVLKFKRLIPLYDAALYLGGDRYQEGARRLEVVYRVGVDVDRFHAAGREVLERNYSEEDLARLAARLERMNSWYPDPKPGDRSAITYLPGQGTALDYNGKRLGVIDGEDFADAYFSIWLGDDPACERLRKQLLGL